MSDSLFEMNYEVLSNGSSVNSHGGSTSQGHTGSSRRIRVCGDQQGHQETGEGLAIQQGGERNLVSPTSAMQQWYYHN